MIKLKSILCESDYDSSINRYKRIGIAQKLVIDRYLEPVMDATAELEYKINNALRNEVISDKDILAAAFGTNGSWDDIILRISSVVEDKILESRGFSLEDNSENYPNDQEKNRAKRETRDAILTSQSEDTIRVLAQNIPLLRKLEHIDQILNRPSKNN